MNAWKDLPNGKHIDWVLTSLLPNAEHIDWVLTSLKAHTQLWREVYRARGLARAQVLEQAYNKILSQGRNKAYDQARDWAWDKNYDQIWYTVSGPCLALIAYDDAEKYLSMTGSELEVWARISEDPCAVLLLPMVQVKEKIKDLETVTS